MVSLTSQNDSLEWQNTEQMYMIPYLKIEVYVLRNDRDTGMGQRDRAAEREFQ